MKRAIIYYSLTNNTKNTAEQLAEELGADVYRIEFVKPLPESKAGQMFEGGRQATFGVKPEIIGIPEDFEQYDEILIGTPIWAGKCASPFNTLFENRALCEKIVAAFTYSGGGDNEGCIKRLKKILPNLELDVALADGKTKFAPQNAGKLQAFIDQLKARG